MTHWRTARQSSGNNQLPGLHIGAGGKRAELNSSDSEFAALSFGIVSALAPVLIVGVLLFIYYALVA